MLIQRATFLDGVSADVRLEHCRIATIGQLAPYPGELVIDAAGGVLLPGLHDHHLHVASLAASLHSVACGPPHIIDAEAFASAVRVPGTDWLRGFGYHESVAGLPDAAALDQIQPERPVRIQHRSGRLWFFNSAGLSKILEGHTPPPGLERSAGIFTGRLFDEDSWLRQVLGSQPPSFAEVGDLLARAGVTGITEISPANEAAIARHFAAEHESGALPQKTLLAGNLSLRQTDMAPGLTLGPAKLHLHEADLPSLDDAVDFARRAHAQNRPLAVHCATEVELIFTLAMFEEAGPKPGDRIEHASVARSGTMDDIARLGLAVVTQPHFIAERGDAYHRDVPPESHADLYRLRSFLDAGIPLAAGSDAPFGQPDPWASMRAAMSRQTAEGKTIGAAEALTPEEALDLYLRDPQALHRTRHIEPGAPADLCLLDCPWQAARQHLSSHSVRATFIDGRLVHDRIDQPPA
jgi:predicted amidohydrolase YtcJ